MDRAGVRSSGVLILAGFELLLEIEQPGLCTRWGGPATFSWWSTSSLCGEMAFADGDKASYSKSWQSSRGVGHLRRQPGWNGLPLISSNQATSGWLRMSGLLKLICGHV